MASEPILELAELSETPSDGFEDRVRRSILRRSLASDLASYVWFTPVRILLEYMGLLLTMIGDSPTEGDGDA